MSVRRNLWVLCMATAALIQGCQFCPVYPDFDFPEEENNDPDNPSQTL